MVFEAAADYARTQGAGLAEGPPVEPAGRLGDAFAWTGIASSFRPAP